MFKAIALALLSLVPLPAQNLPVQETFLYAFPDNREFSGPIGNLVGDNAGNLFGVAADWMYDYVFQITPNGQGGWTESTIFNFNNNPVLPQSNAASTLLLISPDTLVGLTSNQGTYGCGTLFSLTAPGSGTGDWSAQILYSFPCLPGGYFLSSLVSSGGTIIVSTPNGGDYGQGSIVELAPPPGGSGPWSAKTIYSFTGGADGLGPGALVAGPNGAIYGATTSTQGFPFGTLFQLSPPVEPGGLWSEFVILEFPVPGSDVALPYFPLSIDAEGNLYGVSFTSVNGIQMAVVYEVSPPATHGGTWTANSLYTVGSDTPSRYTYITSSAFISRTGAIFGSAYTYCEHSNAFCGYAYRLTPPAPNSGNPWKEAIVFQSNGPSVPWLRGIAPSGTTLYGGADFYFGAGGYVFELSQ